MYFSKDVTVMEPMPTKANSPKCPQRGLGKISELYYLALGSQATQGMASSDK